MSGIWRDNVEPMIDISHISAFLSFNSYQIMPIPAGFQQFFLLPEVWTTTAWLRAFFDVTRSFAASGPGS
jgi:hypothetical protein